MLKSVTTFPPGGFWFYQPETDWPKDARRYFAGKTLNQVVTEVITHRRANPRFNLSLDPGIVSAEIQAHICKDLRERMGQATYLAYCCGEKKTTASVFQPIHHAVAAVADSGKKTIAGIATLLDWLGSGGKPVAAELATARGAVCVSCPLNQQGDWMRFFTIPASEEIRKQIGIKHDLHLETPHDEKLGVCAACLCPMKLKIFVPLSHITAKMKPEVRAQLDPRCWILHENQ